MCPFDYTAVAGSGKVGPVNRITTPGYSNWPSEVDPQPLCNRTFLWRFFVLSLCLFDISAVVGAFVIWLSQISSFFLQIVWYGEHILIFVRWEKLYQVSQPREHEKYKKRLLLRCIHHFKSDLINNMDHIRISGTEPSSVILIQRK